MTIKTRAPFIASAIAATALIACTALLGDLSVGPVPSVGAKCALDCAALPHTKSATCGSDGQCTLGPAQCATGFSDCNKTPGDGCESDLSQAAHCGTCSTICSGPTPLCTSTQAGFSCAATCAAPTTACDASCVDTARDPRNCGNCANACPIDPHGVVSCSGGQCSQPTCNTGYHLCGGKCADDTSPATCGMGCMMCGIPANSTATCTSGLCGFTCNAPTTLCGGMTGSCIDVVNDPLNCGQCGHSCAGGTCAAGKCQPVRLSSAQLLSKSSIALSATDVYFTNGGTSLFSCAIGGCNNSPTAIYSSLTLARSVYYDALKNQVIVGYLGAMYGELKIYDVAGKKTAATFITTSNGNGFENPIGFYGSQTNIYYGDIGYPAIINIDRSNSTQKTNNSLPSLGGWMNHLVFDPQSNQLIFGVGFASTIVKCPLGGGSCSAAIAVAPDPTGVAVNNGTLFFSARGTLPNQTDGGIFSMPTNGSAITKLVTGNGKFSPLNGRLTVDATDIYWGGSTAIYKCAQSGCANTPTQFNNAGNFGDTHSIATDSESVYWADSSGLWKQAK